MMPSSMLLFIPSMAYHRSRWVGARKAEKVIVIRKKLREGPRKMGIKGKKLRNGPRKMTIRGKS